jgi:Nucleotidyltransferase substrate binding protein like
MLIECSLPSPSRCAHAPGDHLRLIHSSLARAEPALAPAFRTAAIKSYEYVYELAIRLIRRALELKAASPSEIDLMDFKTLMRTAAEKGLIDDLCRGLFSAPSATSRLMPTTKHAPPTCSPSCRSCLSAPASSSRA